MNFSLSDLANVVTIASFPLAVVTWLVTRERFAAFWKRFWKWVAVTVVGLFCIGLWKTGHLGWLGMAVSTPLWAVLLVTGLVLSAIVCGIVLASATINEPGPFEYVAGIIFGVEWQWRFSGQMLVEQSFAAFCPNHDCKARLEVLPRPSYASVNSIKVRCQHCGFTQDFDCDHPDLQRRTAVEVERRLRTGEFRSELMTRRKLAPRQR
jgi:hypothetical protein